MLHNDEGRVQDRSFSVTIPTYSYILVIIQAPMVHALNVKLKEEVRL